MDNALFNEIVEQRVEKIKKVLANKAKEYAAAEDRLHNFKVAGRIDAESPERALWGMLKKHLVSLMDMIEKAGTPSFCMSYALWDEKIGDAVNYLILLEALVAERIHLGFGTHVQNEDHGDLTGGINGGYR